MIRHLEIARERWGSFVVLLSRQLAERPIAIEVFGRPLGDQDMGRRLPFRGLAFDPKGSERGNLEVIVGSDEGELSHLIVGPTRLYLGQNDLGEIEWLAIEELGEAGDVKTLIHFERLPELEAEYLDVLSDFPRP